MDTNYENTDYFFLVPSYALYRYYTDYITVYGYYFTSFIFYFKFVIFELLIYYE